tara:strand:+ start:115 stop:504 length:390 start_codon:yes stop_codon:yes gene_type:complete
MIKYIPKRIQNLSNPWKGFNTLLLLISLSISVLYTVLFPILLNPNIGDSPSFLVYLFPVLISVIICIFGYILLLNIYLKLYVGFGKNIISALIALVIVCFLLRIGIFFSFMIILLVFGFFNNIMLFLFL